MNDITKLNQVITTLEEQAAQVNELNGVLGAISDAKSSIEASRNTIRNQTEQIQSLLSESHQQLKALNEKYTALEELVSQNRERLGTLSHSLSTLEVVTPNQFEHGRDKILLKLSDLNFMTPEMFDKGCTAIQRTTVESAADFRDRLEEITREQQSAISSLRRVMIMGMLVLAAGILFVGKDIFLSRWL